ncbi:SARP family transcriptional regulator [Paracoccus limosus]|uniref:SARP family transcriptional regulator n=1 Tax=Paracoccus limosus TaxID=913252 RepID=A0A844H4W1_9RHOB|nr:BTAD domain-containing putative transcriptional regulator [Paracoccus limosus]MTH34604.1 SARP family transcriptional regulator [Paracoccus limosus]
MPQIQMLLGILDAVRLRKGRALLYFLMADRARVHRTEKVIDLFWQDSDERRASASYRQAVKHIRRAMAEIPATDASVSLETTMGEVALRLAQPFDLQQELLAALSQPGWDPAAARPVRAVIERGLQLEGISASFDSWLAISRTTLLAAIRQVLDQRLADVESQLETRRALAEFAIELEPANENATRILMRMDWQGGRPTRAIERYNALYAHLDEAFDQEPEAETVELLAAIKLDPAGGGRIGPQATRDAQLNLSLQLVDTQMPGGELAPLTTVVFADLRMRMGRFREWRLVGTDPPDLVQALVLVRPYLMLGRLRLSVEVQRGSGELIWSEWVEEPQTEWEHKVRQLLANIASALSVVISDRALAESGSGVYDSWLKAQALLDRWSPESEGAALQMLRDITAQAPRFGPAHAELAGALNVRHVLLPGTLQTEEIKRDAMHHAIVAVSVDPMDTRAHRVLAWCFCHLGYFDLADFHFDQALSLNRSNMLTLVSCCLGFAFIGDLVKAAALAAEAKSHAAVQEPFHQIYLAAADYLLGDYPAAARQCEAGAGLMPTVGGWHAAALWKNGQQDEAARRLDSYLDELRGQWRGPPDPSEAQMLDWFLAVFPLRHDHWRDDMRNVLDAILRHRIAMPH